MAALPNGYVVLPGLDRGSDLWDDMAADSSHPQHALAELLDALLRPDQVKDWPCVPVESPKQKARRKFMRGYFARRRLPRRGKGLGMARIAGSCGAR